MSSLCLREVARVSNSFHAAQFAAVANEDRLAVPLLFKPWLLRVSTAVFRIKGFRRVSLEAIVALLAVQTVLLPYI